MPNISFQEALRYFFAPFLVFFYLAIYDVSLAKCLQAELGALGAISFLVSGSVIYFLYRYLVFDYIITWLLYQAGWSYSNYFETRFEIKKGNWWTPACLKRAMQLFYQLSYAEGSVLPAERFRLRASGIHLLFQASVLALPFMAAAAWNSQTYLAIFFAVIAGLLFSIGFLVMSDHQAEELIVIKQASEQQINLAAANLNLAPTACYVGLKSKPVLS